MSETQRVAVVGGGISGLATAWFLRQRLGPRAQIVVLEKGRTVGGHLRVSDVAGVPVDEGAESLLARRPEAVALARAAGLDSAVVHPASVGAGVWSRGAIRPMPAGTVMGVPDDPSTLTGLLTDTEIAATEGTDDAPMQVHDDVSIGDLVTARMGPAVVDRLIEPLLGGVYAGHARELSLDATVPALGAAVRRHRSLRAAVADVRSGGAPTEPATVPSPPFAGIEGGIGRLPGAVARAAAADLHTGVTVRELHRTPTGWRLVTGPVPQPELIDADAVVLAVPAAPSARLLREVAPAAATELAAIETASMAIVTMAVPRSGFPAAPSSSGFLVPPVDGRAVKAVTYSSVKWPWLGERSDDLVLLRASLGRHRQAEILQRDDDDLVAAVLADLHDATGLQAVPVDARVTRWGGALPQYAVGHLARIARVDAAVDAVPGLAVAGAVYDGVGVAACVARAERAATRVVAALNSAGVTIVV